MGRFGTLIGLFVYALGSAQQAHALSAECTEPLLSSPQDARSERAEQSAAIAPAAIAPAAIAPAAALPLGNDDESELPWCVSPEDPRCSPLPGQSAPSQLVLGQFIGASGVAELPARWTARTAEPFPLCGLPPANGVRNRLERPPRLPGR
ncbi:MAG TPA: hypothetical protein VK509_18365 [Polyangiales bacterium]|nr:hypothetical protein [Polyangiales bacterium]